jgi:hypothetical protein
MKHIYKKFIVEKLRTLFSTGIELIESVLKKMKDPIYNKHI